MHLGGTIYLTVMEEPDFNNNLRLVVRKVDFSDFTTTTLTWPQAAGSNTVRSLNVLADGGFEITYDSFSDTLSTACSDTGNSCTVHVARFDADCQLVDSREVGSGEKARTAVAVNLKHLAVYQRENPSTQETEVYSILLDEDLEPAGSEETVRGSESSSYTHPALEGLLIVPSSFSDPRAAQRRGTAPDHDFRVLYTGPGDTVSDTSILSRTIDADGFPLEP